MVDSINGAGSVQNVAQASRTQNTKNTAVNSASSSEGAAAIDEVSLSDEALAAQAEDTARQTRTILQELLDETLSTDRKRVDRLL